jgi:ribosomal protein S18 acetylase RimI-like enzyme
MLERFNTIRLRQLRPHDEIWTTDTLGCAALWAPPEHWKTTPREDLQIGRVLAHPRLMWRLPLLTVGFGGMEKAHPHTPPHWYLAVLGTEPDMQGQGLGSAVLAPVLEQCDNDGVAAYLESSKETNIAFYGRHGFRVTGEIQLPRGPKMWQMWRDPRP